MTPKRPTWPVLSRSSWMTDGLPRGLNPTRVGGTAQQTNQWPAFILKLTGMTDSHVPTHNRGGVGGRDG